MGIIGHSSHKSYTEFMWNVPCGININFHWMLFQVQEYTCQSKNWTSWKFWGICLIENRMVYRMENLPAVAVPSWFSNSESVFPTITLSVPRPRFMPSSISMWWIYLFSNSYFLFIKFYTNILFIHLSFISAQIEFKYWKTLLLNRVWQQIRKTCEYVWNECKKRICWRSSQYRFFFVAQEDHI